MNKYEYTTKMAGSYNAEIGYRSDNLGTDH
jgi:hypothetical protein